MKTMSCDLCSKEFSAETFDQWFAQMRTHYIEDHADFMEQAKNKAKDGGKEEGMKWMANMKAKFAE